MSSVLHAIFEPGFFSSELTPAAIGGLVAIVAAGVGAFTVIRGQSFAGEALGDIGSAGGSSAYLVPVPAIWGFLAITVAAAGVMELIGIQRARGRDLATGIVLGFGFGLTALFLYLGTTTTSTTGAPIVILFGSLAEISSSYLPIVLALGGITAAILVALYRPLLLVSVSPELAAARGIPVRLIGAAYLIALAVAVALADLTIGAILSTALIVGPAATALRLTSRPAHAALAAAGIGLGCVWLGLLLAWDSYYWPHHGWPVSFFVVTLIMLVYLLAGVRRPNAARARRS
ncbi:MAG TPA: metal ABC transporter permease [Solirubrobacteraceae bacterium]|jgi:zinc/manganese transport system permease protein|nr:metal ABC transporter permease [Solirubrobacteraceae bacterium]